MTKITDARRSLVRAKEAAQERMLQIEEERREIKVSIKSLDAALKALDGPKRDPKPNIGQALSSTENDAH